MTTEKQLWEIQADNDTMLYASAARGARKLDEDIPDWPTRIDVSRLRMENGESCILGQLFMADVSDQLRTGYAVGIRQLDLTPLIVEQYGFTLPSNLHCECDYGGVCVGYGPREWSVLAEAWVDEIKYRLDKGVKI